MKEYVLLIRLNPAPMTPEIVAAVRNNWAVLREHWEQKGCYVSGNRIVQEGFLLSGADRVLSKGAVAEDGVRIISTITLLAEDMEAAIELAKACPPLDYGATVEVREALPNPVLTGE